MYPGYSLQLYFSASLRAIRLRLLFLSERVWPGIKSFRAQHPQHGIRYFIGVKWRVFQRLLNGATNDKPQNRTLAEAKAMLQQIKA